MPLARTKETSYEQSVSTMIGSTDRSSTRDKPSKQAISSASSGSVHGAIYLQEEKMIDPPSSLRIVPDPALPSLKEPSTESLTKPTEAYTRGRSERREVLEPDPPRLPPVAFLSR
jgi:hypothetical protein